MVLRQTHTDQQEEISVCVNSSLDSSGFDNALANITILQQSEDGSNSFQYASSLATTSRNNGNVGIRDSLLECDDASAIGSSTYDWENIMFPSTASSNQLVPTSKTKENRTRWTCKFCGLVSFETEHEEMVHQLSCASNSDGPLVDGSVRHPNDDYSAIGRHGTSNEDRRRRLGRKLLCKLNKKKTKTHIDKNDSYQNEMNGYEVSDSNKDCGKMFKRKIKTLLRKTLNVNKKSTRFSTSQMDTTAITMPDSSDNFSTSSFGGTECGYFPPNCLSHTNEEYPFARNFTRSNYKSPIGSGIGALNMFQKTSPISHSALQTRIPSEQVLKKLGFLEGAKKAIEELKRQDSCSSIESDSSDPSLQEIQVPMYKECMELAVTTIRRDVLGISDQLYDAMRGNKDVHGIMSCDNN